MVCESYDTNKIHKQVGMDSTEDDGYKLICKQRLRAVLNEVLNNSFSISEEKKAFEDVRNLTNLKLNIFVMYLKNVDCFEHKDCKGSLNSQLHRCKCEKSVT